VTQMTDLRAKARKDGVYLRIVKNTLARKAVAAPPSMHFSGVKGPIVLDSPTTTGRRRPHRQGVLKDNDNW